MKHRGREFSYLDSETFLRTAQENPMALGKHLLQKANEFMLRRNASRRVHVIFSDQEEVFKVSGATQHWGAFYL